MSAPVLIAPERLNQLLVDPDDSYLDLFLHQVGEYFGQLPPRMREAIDLGPRYQAFLAQVRAPGTPRVYRILAALVYLLCVPMACERLHPKDVSFLEDFNRAVGNWLMGLMRNGAPYTPDADLVQGHTVAFVVGQLDLYRWAFAVEKRE